MSPYKQTYKWVPGGTFVKEQILCLHYQRHQRRTNREKYVSRKFGSGIEGKLCRFSKLNPTCPGLRKSI